jgi:MerR family transcriptional regulator, light-induced transcriptional regulator
METHLSPAQVARALGVSESSLKRWCDQGLIPIVRTVGGHRKLPLAAVLAFVRERGKRVVEPEVLGLPAVTGRSTVTLDRAVETLFGILQKSEGDQARRVVYDLYLAGHGLAAICDQVLSVIFQRLGIAWECGELEIYRERRACEIIYRLLNEISLALPPVSLEAPLALGATLQHDYYQIPSTMVELVLREQGWQARSLGCNLPAATLIAALREQRPKLFWLSASHIDDTTTFISEFNKLAEAAQDLKVAVILGGRALTPELRQQLVFTAHCENLRELQSLSQTLLQNQK